MPESEPESGPSSPSQPIQIMELLHSAGYVDVDPDDDHNNSSDLDKLFRALAWCISSITSNPKIDTVKDIEDALKLMGCPHVLQASQIEAVDYVGLYSAVNWLVSLVKTQQRDSGYMNENKTAVLNELQLLKERIDQAGIDSTVQKLASLLKTLKALERQGFDLQAECNKKRFALLSEITELEKKLANAADDKNLYDYIDHLIYDMSKKLNCAKRELSSTLRESVCLNRQLDDLPIQEEVVQYEQRFSELDVHIQDRLHRTRKYYATYNALLETKDLMLKEISLLNSLDSQFQDVLGNPAGHMKLLDAMEAILKGIRQKLEKLQPGLQAEHEAFDILKEHYNAAMTNQRRRSGLLKALQQERTKNERLKEECAKNGRLKEERGKE